MPSQPPRVFISYSHDSPAHEQRVLALAERLRQDAIEAQIDRYVNGTPAEGWPRWMENQLEWADFVLLVCTEIYYRRFRGHEQPEKGRGVDWEGALVTNEMYDDEVLQRSLCQPYFPLMRQNLSRGRFGVIRITFWIPKITTRNFSLSLPAGQGCCPVRSVR
jgi:hypothetical protein